MRTFWYCVGIAAMALGVVGLFLPVMPTAPFMILAAWAFSKSSDRLHGWLLNHRVFGPFIRDWEESGAMSRRAKQFSIGGMAVAFGSSVIIGIPLWALIVEAVVLLVVAAWIIRRPPSPRDRPRNQADKKSGARLPQEKRSSTAG